MVSALCDIAGKRQSARFPSTRLGHSVQRWRSPRCKDDGSARTRCVSGESCAYSRGCTSNNNDSVGERHTLRLYTTRLYSQQ